MRRSAIGQIVLVAVLVAACGTSPGAGPDPVSGSRTPESANSTAASTPAPTASSAGDAPASRPAAGSKELPRGGQAIFPRYRLVGYAGVTGAASLGRLGTGPLDQRVAELEKRAQPYRAGRDILPVLEVITTVVHDSPGDDGKYRTRMSDDQIGRYLRAARRHRALLLLNIQPGRADFLAEVKAYRKWLQEADVGIALDPEWAMDAGQIPGHAYGHTTGAELNDVADYLAEIVRARHLPEKVLVYHQVARSVVRHENAVTGHAGVVLIKSVDGLGAPGPKVDTYRLVNRGTPRHVHAGFKLFFTEDRRNGGRLMNPREVLALRPRPEYIMYE
ncbi:hypothetical protein GCM10022236_15410 [Microlunatus ginsengisoli]|uniref:Lipoprotein n=1 Tax=Microlunatus ginsengisoli TaxID=363863 RepID=A0ABP6ZRC4_9ACTN